MKRKAEAWAAVGSDGAMGGLGYGRETATQYALINGLRLTRLVPADPDLERVGREALALFRRVRGEHVPKGRGTVKSLKAAVEKLQKGRK